MSIANRTLTQLRALRLTTMAEAYENQLLQPKLHEFGFDERLAMLVDQEQNERESRKLKRLIRDAALPDRASLEDIEFRPDRGLEKQIVANLSSCEWIKRQLNVIILGATGVGKTWLASAFGNQACRLRLPVMFYRASDLYEAISTSSLDGSLAKLKVSLERPSLLIIDDFGLGNLTSPISQVLLDVIDHRVRTGSLLITSQYPTNQWHDFFPDKTLADAILDRVVHQSHCLTLKGESMRKLNARKRLEEA